jgi:hypothetical protein
LEGVVFLALQESDTNGFMGKGRVYGGGLYKMEPKELGQIEAEGVVGGDDGAPGGGGDGEGVAVFWVKGWYAD